MLAQKLQDPDGLVEPAKLRELEKKISACVTGLYRKPVNGGNPFLYALTVAKPHFLVADKDMAEEMAAKGKKVNNVIPCATAATDGQCFMWHPDFLEKLTVEEVPTVMEHEGLHVIFDHPNRMKNAHRDCRAYAIDYVVNSCIEHNHQALSRKGQLWGGNLGTPVPLKQLLDHIDGLIEAFPDDGKARIFADPACYGRSPESIYDEIMDHWDKSPRKCKKCGSLRMDPKTKKPKKAPCSNRPNCKHKGSCCPECGAEIRSGEGDGDGIPMSGMPSALDGHVKQKVSRQQVQNEVMRAAEHTKSMRGTVPSQIHDMLSELMEPVISWTDIVFSDCMRRAMEAGLLNDWSRPRKRWIDEAHLPSRYDHNQRWLAMLDTSGSMSKRDMAFVTSQLKVLVAKGTEGVIVPCDGSPHWEAATQVKNLGDLQTTKVVGRGGTVFEDFFRDYRKKVGEDFDAIIILTDGDCGTIPMGLRPPIPVTWVLTKSISGWNPTFGRTAPLRNERM